MNHQLPLGVQQTPMGPPPAAFGHQCPPRCGAPYPRLPPPPISVPHDRLFFRPPFLPSAPPCRPTTIFHHPRSRSFLENRPPPTQLAFPTSLPSPGACPRAESRLTGGPHLSNQIAATGTSQSQKTPMCQIAELGRYNKLCHKYQLVDERGPAHDKTFTVTLKLREAEDYTGQGASIKKAQQEAAQKALELTSLPKPPPRQNPLRNGPLKHSQSDALTPTVMLNAVAHQMGLVPVYKFLEPSPSMVHSGMDGLVRTAPHLFGQGLNAVSLRIGGYEFIGHGHTRQLAKHKCAAQALHILHNHPDFPDAVRITADVGPKPETNGPKTEEEEVERQLQTKSPISLVHEIALQKCMEVTFEVVSENGPAHSRTFLVKCILRNPLQVAETEGEGASKKLAKHDACKNMLERLKQDGPLPLPGTLGPRRPRMPKELKRKTIVKDIKMDPNYGQQINPVSRLIQIQQAKKELEPVFEFVKETGQARYKEFTVKVTLNGIECEGTGPNKKLAKRAAAEAVLEDMGYAKPLPKPGKSVLKQSSCAGEEEQAREDSEEGSDKAGNGDVGAGEKGRKVHFSLETEEREIPAGLTPDNHFMYPGVIFMSPMGKRSRTPVPQTEEMSRMANEMLGSFQQLNVNGGRPIVALGSAENAILCFDAKQKLAYLAGMMGFQIQYTDFPKTVKEDGSGEHLSLVSLGISPPRVCHGSGESVEAAQTEAALSALRALANHPVNNFCPSINCRKITRNNESSVSEMCSAEACDSVPVEDLPPPEELLSDASPVASNQD